jgi:hypothetical protein
MKKLDFEVTLTEQADRHQSFFVNSYLVDTLRVEDLLFPNSFRDVGHFGSGSGLLSHRVSLQIELLALRHQLNVLERSVKRPNLELRTGSLEHFWQPLGGAGALH